MAGQMKPLIRQTKETRVEVALKPGGRGRASVETGIGFLDHMLGTWALYAGVDLSLRCDGDLHVDAHHTAEDSALALGEALDVSLGSREGIARFGWAYAPLEEALARAALDLARRPFYAGAFPVLPPMLGTLPGEMVPHVLRSFAFAGRFTLHADVLRSENGHHAVEAAFKSMGLAFAMALAPKGRGARSAKGVL